MTGLNYQFVESVFSMPADLCVGNGVYQETLHQLLGDRVPREVLKAPKRGFILPLRDWTVGSPRERILDTLSPQRLRQQGLFSAKIIQRLVQPHMTGRRDFTRQIWSLFMFQLWYEQYA